MSSDSETVVQNIPESSPQNVQTPPMENIGNENQGVNIESKEVPHMLVPEPIRSTMVDSFRALYKNLIFRRVGRSITHQADLVEKLFFIDDANCNLRGKNDTTHYTTEQMQKNVELRYKKYFGFTTQTVLRDNDPHEGVELFFTSNRYAELDITNRMTFKFASRVNSVPPRTGDLICGILSPTPQGQDKNPKFDRWFICSEQFMRLWTLIMYDDHASFDSLTKLPKVETERIRDNVCLAFSSQPPLERQQAGDVAEVETPLVSVWSPEHQNMFEEEIKKAKAARLFDKMMTGNRLCVNNYWKKVKAFELANKELSNEEKAKSYFRLRTESVTREWCHVYVALALMLRFGEYPVPSNAPVTLDDGPQLGFWHLPENFVERVVERLAPAQCSS